MIDTSAEVRLCPSGFRPHFRFQEHISPNWRRFGVTLPFRNKFYHFRMTWLIFIAEKFWSSMFHVESTNPSTSQVLRFAVREEIKSFSPIDWRKTTGWRWGKDSNTILDEMYEKLGEFFMNGQNTSDVHTCVAKWSMFWDGTLLSKVCYKIVVKLNTDCVQNVVTICAAGWASPTMGLT
jgi:hypothetical protein